MCLVITQKGLEWPRGDVIRSKSTRPQIRLCRNERFFVGGQIKERIESIIVYSNGLLIYIYKYAKNKINLKRSYLYQAISLILTYLTGNHSAFLSS